MSKILIPADYWNGPDTLELEYPWITPEAICTLDCFVKPTHEVLEFGAGGSTVFFARRARFVTSIENSPHWAMRVKYAMKIKGLDNYNLYVAPTTETVPDLGTQMFDVALVDCCEIDRRAATMIALRTLRPGGMLVIDNYAASYCEGIEIMLAGYHNQVNFDDMHWLPCGRGTKVVYV